MYKLKPVLTARDIPQSLRETPIGRLLEYHNLDRPFRTYEKAELLIGMCIDNRKHMHMPDNFSFIIRAGGANLRNSEFKVSFAVAIGGVKHLALIGHTHCGMMNLAARKTAFVEGLVKNGGWKKDEATQHFEWFAPSHEIKNEMDFTFNEAKRLAARYPHITVVPMIYKVEDGRLYLLRHTGRSKA